MTKPKLFTFVCSILLFASSAQLSEAHGPAHNPSRFDYVMQNGIPEPYHGVLNPLRMTPENVSSGQILYDVNCAACHGATGEGGGESAGAGGPAPPRLTDMYDRAMHGMGHAQSGGHLMHGRLHHHPGMKHAEAMGGLNLDAYNFWSISEGGKLLGSSMPAFKKILSERERWEILLYVANGFSAVASKK